MHIKVSFYSVLPKQNNEKKSHFIALKWKLVCHLFYFLTFEMVRWWMFVHSNDISTEMLKNWNFHIPFHVILLFSPDSLWNWWTFSFAMDIFHFISRRKNSVKCQFSGFRNNKNHFSGLFEKALSILKAMCQSLNHSVQCWT